MTLDDGRQTILARLAAAAVDAPAARPGPLPEVAPAAERDTDALVERFVRALDQLCVQWEVAESPVVARLTLATRLQEEGIKQVLSWSADQLPIGGVLEALEVEPHQAIHIGDSEDDINGAKAAGIRPILFDPYRQNPNAIGELAWVVEYATGRVEWL